MLSFYKDSCKKRYILNLNRKSSNEFLSLYLSEKTSWISEFKYISISYSLKLSFKYTTKY